MRGISVGTILRGNVRFVTIGIVAPGTDVVVAMSAAEANVLGECLKGLSDVAMFENDAQVIEGVVIESH